MIVSGDAGLYSIFYKQKNFRDTNDTKLIFKVTVLAKIMCRDHREVKTLFSWLLTMKRGILMFLMKCWFKNDISCSFMVFFSAPERFHITYVTQAWLDGLDVEKNLQKGLSVFITWKLEPKCLDHNSKLTKRLTTYRAQNQNSVYEYIDKES